MFFMLQILQCELLVAIGYCFITQQNSSEGEKHIILALNTFHEVVSGSEHFKTLQYPSSYE